MLGEQLMARGANALARRLWPMCVIGAALTFALSASAARSRLTGSLVWHEPSSRPRAGSAASIADAFLVHQGVGLGLRGVQLTRHGDLELHGAHVLRYQQRHGGVPVYGAGLALWVDADGRVRALVGDVAPVSGDSTPAISRQRASSRVAALAGPSGVSGGAPELMWWRGASGQARLVWRIDSLTTNGAERFLVDAKTGGWVKRLALGRSVLGRVSRGGSLTEPAYVDVELDALDLGSPQRLRGWGGALDVANYVDGGFLQGHVDYEQTLGPGPGGDFLFMPPKSPLDAQDAFAQVSLYEQMSRMRRAYERLGVDFTSAKWRLLVVANMQENGAPFDNAYFAPLDMGGTLAAPNFIGIGQGSLGDFAVDADVAMHEFTHYVTHNSINFNQGWYWTNEFGLSPWASAIDEGLADYFMASETNDPVVGDTVLEAYGLVRRLDDASKRCPGDLGGEPHADGELIGSLGWTLHQRFGQARADRLMWSAATLLGPDATLGDFARGLELAAEDLQGRGEFSEAERTVLDMLVMQRGLDDCDAVLDVSPASPRHVLLATGGEGLGYECGELRNQGYFQQSLFQFRVTPPGGATGMKLRVELLSGSPAHLSWSLFARGGEHIGMNDDGFLPRVESFNYSVRNITTRSAELVIDDTRLPAFDPEQAYFFSIEHQNCITSEAVASVEYTWSPSSGGAGGVGGSAGGESGAGAGGAIGGHGNGGEGEQGGQPVDWEDVERRSSGCGCAVPRRGAPPIKLVFPLLGLALLVRRRS